MEPTQLKAYSSHHRGQDTNSPSKEEVHAKSRDEQVKQRRQIKPEWLAGRNSEDQPCWRKNAIPKVEQCFFSTTSVRIPQWELAGSGLISGIHPFREPGIEDVRAFALPNTHPWIYVGPCALANENIKGSYGFPFKGVCSGSRDRDEQVENGKKQF
jgi:hypothetical protein